MKKILFVVCTHGNEMAGYELFLRHPYGRHGNIEWEIIVGNPEDVFLNQRYTYTDLNRSFNTPVASSYEEKRTFI